MELTKPHYAGWMCILIGVIYSTNGKDWLAIGYFSLAIILFLSDIIRK